MGDTRIDGSTPRTTPECDEDTGVCGAVKKPDPQVSFDYLYEDQSHVLPDPKPAHVAEIAKNMSTPKPPTHDELLAQYGKMTDAELEAALAPLQKKLQTPTYPDAATDRARFNAIEHVVSLRNDELHKDDGAARHLFPYADEAVYRGKDFTVGHFSTEWTLEHRGTSGSILHGQHTWHVDSVDLSASGDAGSAGIDQGVHNVDGSTGFHTSGGATIVGVEGTVHKSGLGSATFGVGKGPSIEVSAGEKQEGKTTLDCVRVGVAFVTAGLCFPIGQSK